jgi:hypothetical protein
MSDMPERGAALAKCAPTSPSALGGGSAPTSAGALPPPLTWLSGSGDHSGLFSLGVHGYDLPSFSGAEVLQVHCG